MHWPFHRLMDGQQLIVILIVFFILFICRQKKKREREREINGQDMLFVYSDK